MAGTNRKDWEELNITKEEVENLKEALKKEEFRKLLAEYADEITRPENRKLYQEEIIQLEAERGVDCTFIDPEPGFVVKTSVDGSKKAFVNICQNNVIDRPSSKPVLKDNSRGLSWSIPFSQSPGREDHDKKRNRCVVYDVVFHPDTLCLAEKSSEFRSLVIDTALSAIEDSYNVKLDKKNLKFPKLKFKGLPVASVIRRKSKKQPILTEDEIEFQKNLKYPAPPPTDGERKPVVRNFDHAKEDKEKYTFPKYVIKHRTGIDLQEFTYDRNCKMNIAIPKELVIEINLPMLSSTKNAELNVMTKSLHLKSEKPAMYKLDIELPYAVNEEEGSAKFDKDTKVLTITLPVIKAKVNSVDLMREDSGVESDFGDRCTSCDDASPVGSVVNQEEKIEELESPCNNISPPVIVECDVTENLKKTSEKERETSKPFRTKNELNSFLDVDKQYLLPPYKCNADGNHLCFVLNVKNVDPNSVVKQMQGTNGCHLKFLSLGSGFYPVFYAFLIKFQDDCQIKDVTADTWDNNVTVQVELNNTDLASIYYIGTDEGSLTVKNWSNVIQLERKLEKLKLNTEIELEEDDENPCEEPVVTVESAGANEVVVTVKNDKSEAQKEKRKSKNAKVNTSQVNDKKLRTLSESSTDEVNLSPVRQKSILKNRICRSLSESNAEDYGLGSSIDASEGSDLCIPHEPEESHCSKKTVRFNDRIAKQIFRANSSILGQKKKNQKRSRNKRKVGERRVSESENSECEEKERECGNPLIEVIDENGKGTNCDKTTKTVKTRSKATKAATRTNAEAAISEENESSCQTEVEGKNEIRFTMKKDDKISEFKSDLIFDLDL